MTYRLNSFLSIILILALTGCGNASSAPGSAASVQTIPEVKKEEFKDTKSSGTPSNGVLLFTEEAARAINSSSEKFDIVIVGDTNHSDRAISDVLAQDILALKLGIPESDCLLLELDQATQPGIEAFKRPGDFVRFMKEKLPHQQILGGSEKIDIRLSAAKRSRMRVFSIDSITIETELAKAAFLNAAKIGRTESDMDPAIRTRFVNSVINKRNEFFSQEIIRLMQNGICRKPILIVGAAHLMDSALGVPITSVQKLLAAKEIKSVVGSVWKVDCVAFDDNKSCDRFKSYLDQVQKPMAKLSDPNLRQTPSFVLIAK